MLGNQDFQEFWEFLDQGYVKHIFLTHTFQSRLSKTSLWFDSKSSLLKVELSLH